MSQAINNKSFVDKTKSFSEGMDYLFLGIGKVLIMILAVIASVGVGWFAYICYTNPNESLVGGLTLFILLVAGYRYKQSRESSIELDPSSPTPLTHPVISNDDKTSVGSSSSSSQEKTVYKTSQADIVAGVKNYLGNSKNKKESLNLRDKISIQEIQKYWGKKPDGSCIVSREEIVEAVINANTDFIVENDICKVRKMLLFDRKKLRDIQLLIERLHHSSPKLYNRDDSIVIDQILTAGHLDHKAELQLDYLYKRYEPLLEQERQRADRAAAEGVR